MTAPSEFSCDILIRGATVLVVCQNSIERNFPDFTSLCRRPASEARNTYDEVDLPGFDLIAVAAHAAAVLLAKGGEASREGVVPGMRLARDG